MVADRVIKILKEKEMFAKKKFGQNFLLDKNVLNKIVEISNIEKDDTIIEIGPGLGCLTEFLSLSAKKVICYEIDKDMVEMLKETLAEYKNIEINHIDFLKADLSAYKKDECKNIKVVANLPYYITTPIIFKLLSETNIPQFTFMVQKEVGERLTGKPNTKDYNSLSVAMNFKTDSKIAYKVSPKCFYPAPNVDSVLLLVKTKKTGCDPNFEPKFLDFIQIAFQQRRKTLVNNMDGKYGYNKAQLIEIFNNNNINPSVRAESLNTEELIYICKIILETK